MFFLYIVYVGPLIVHTCFLLILVFFGGVFMFAHFLESDIIVTPF